MPRYDFKCTNEECGLIQEFVLRISESDQLIPCSHCKSDMKRTFIAANWEGQMVLRGEWPGKLMKENDYRVKRSEQMAKRQKDNHFVPTLAPNVGGERTDSWGDAKKLARDKGLDTTYYDEKVNALKGTNAKGI